MHRMSRSVKKVMVAVLAMVLVIFAPCANSDALFEGCGISVLGFTPCLPDVAKPHPSVSMSCCRVFTSANLNCMCMFKTKFPGIGLTPLAFMNIVSGCNIPAPLFCFN